MPSVTTAGHTRTAQCHSAKCAAKDVGHDAGPCEAGNDERPAISGGSVISRESTVSRDSTFSEEWG